MDRYCACDVLLLPHETRCSTCRLILFQVNELWPLFQRRELCYLCCVALASHEEGMCQSCEGRDLVRQTQTIVRKWLLCVLMARLARLDRGHKI